jgi:hypothetical protein
VVVVVVQIQVVLSPLVLVDRVVEQVVAQLTVAWAQLIRETAAATLFKVVQTFQILT